MNSVRIFRRKKDITKDVYSGKLMLRLDPDTHKNLSVTAQNMGVSMNLLMNMIIEKGLKEIEKEK